ncbi:hypothetical protein TWF718_011088 [Orbilia javanica]|uniref:Ankyrin repeat protein n=1 Tax=Orbilia javanica TaxID=47235 RepID=A0AAN8RCA7_9PEZI
MLEIVVRTGYHGCLRRSGSSIARWVGQSIKVPEAASSAEIYSPFPSQLHIIFGQQLQKKYSTSPTSQQLPTPTVTTMSSSETLPSLPVEPASFLSYLSENSSKPVRDLLPPYLEYESKLRTLFAQDPSNAVLADNTVGLVPIYTGSGLEANIKVQARNLEAETPEQKSKYLMELDAKLRKKDGERAIVDFDQFKTNFTLFSEGALQNLDWTNIIAAGSSVLTPLLPIPEEHRQTKRSMRDWYHDKLAPSSDVDLFIYGIKDEEVAIKRMESIEATIRDNLLWETSSIRTKNTITIISQYPNRHVQIVLRLYSSISEILTGFDVNCACVAYDGSQVYANPRAIASWMLQCNDIDITRRSPSYEFRLGKYRKRGFEAYYPALTREKIDPTIYERSINRLKGLAKLLVLERLPDVEERDSYLEDRRRERGRPDKRNAVFRKTLNGDLKAQGDEVPEWDITEEEQANYHTVSIPYGKPHNAKRSEKLIYQKDMLLNAEWNKRAQKERPAYLHRHPAFIGSVKDIIDDCCGYCPEATTEEEKALQAEDDKFFVRGKISFIRDDPGRQEVGSFNPITEEDWTEMAYIGDDETLCKAIVAHDAELIKKWVTEEGHDVNRRDHTGRTPLHLAALASTPEIVKILLDAGAKLIWRLVDGRTALHIAAARGDPEIVKLLLLKSQENEQIRDEKEDKERAAKGLAGKSKKDDKKDEEMREVEESENEDEEMTEDGNEDSDIEMVSEGESEGGSVAARTARTGASSFVEISKKKSDEPEAGALGSEEEETDDILDLNLADWDYQMCPLHYAIVNGHGDVVELLVSEFGADVLQPIKISFDYNGQPRSALLTINLIVHLPKKEQREMMLRTLLKLGASSGQADMNGNSAFTRIVQMGDIECLKILFEEDAATALAASRHIALSGDWRPSPISNLMVAICEGDEEKALLLLDKGVPPEITFDDFMTAIKRQTKKYTQSRETNQSNFEEYHQQPAELALEAEMPDVFRKCIELGVGLNTYSAGSFVPEPDSDGNYPSSRYNQKFFTYLDLARRKLKQLQNSLENHHEAQKKKIDNSLPREILSVPSEYKEGSYEYWMASQMVESENNVRKAFNKELEKRKAEGHQDNTDPEKVKLKEEKLLALEQKYQELVDWMVSNGAKRFKELQPVYWKKNKSGKSGNWFDDESSDGGQSETSSQKKLPKPEKKFEIQFTFSDAHKDEKLTAAYHELFKAAWDGNGEIITKYTTTSWDEEKTPLLITTTNQLNHNIFAIAAYRKHPKELLDLILSIATAQKRPEEENEKQYNPYYEDEYDSEVESENEGMELHVTQIDLTEGRLTIDNVANLGKEVRSNTSALDMIKFRLPFILDGEGIDKAKIGESTLLYQAVRVGDVELLQYITSTMDKLEPNGRKFDVGVFCNIGSMRDHCSGAVEFQHIGVLETLMEWDGVGALLDEKVKDSKEGEEEEEEGPAKPKHYLGLSIHGKKRTDWAKAANPNDNTIVTKSYRQPIGLYAAYYGSHKVFEWLLTDGPERTLRQYQKKLEGLKHIEYNPLLKALQKADSATIRRWTGVDHPLLLHAIVLNREVSQDKEKTDEEKVSWYTNNIKYFLSRNPKLLEAKENTHNVTPLLLAGSDLNKHAIKALLDVGADIYAKQGETGCNLIHTIVNNCKHFDDERRTRSWEDINSCLEVLPEDFKTWAFTQRALGDDVAYTPLAYFMARDRNYYGVAKTPCVATVEKILEHSKGGDLSVRTSLGDLPIHTATKRSEVDTLKKILAVATPEIIVAENANGMTSLELAESKRYQHIVKDLPSTEYSSWGGWTYSGASRMSTSRDIQEDVKWGYEKEDSDETKTWKMLDHASKEAISGGRVPRVLVSLKEANETAERLAKRSSREKKQRRRYYYSNRNNDAGDIVAKWH